MDNKIPNENDIISDINKIIGENKPLSVFLQFDNDFPQEIHFGNLIGKQVTFTVPVGKSLVFQDAKTGRVFRLFVNEKTEIPIITKDNLPVEVKGEEIQEPNEEIKKDNSPTNN